MEGSQRLQNAKRLAEALEQHSGEWGLMQQLALRMQYDPQQLRQDIHDLASCFQEKSSMNADSDIHDEQRG